jgi:hypothetical protein
METVAGVLVRLCLFLFFLDEDNDGGLFVFSSGLLLLPVVEATGLIDEGTVAAIDTFGCIFFPFGLSILCGRTQIIPRLVLDFVVGAVLETMFLFA